MYMTVSFDEQTLLMVFHQTNDELVILHCVLYPFNYLNKGGDIIAIEKK